MDGQTKVINRGLESYSCCFMILNLKQWAKWLQWVEFNYNTSYHASTRLTPFEVVYDRLPPALLPYDHEPSIVAEVDSQLREHDLMLSNLKIFL